MPVIVFIKTPNCKGYTKSPYCYYFRALSKSLPREKVYLWPSPRTLLSAAYPAFSPPRPPHAPAFKAGLVKSSQPVFGAPSEPSSMLFLPPGTPSPSPHSARNSFLPAGPIPAPGKPLPATLVHAVSSPPECPSTAHSGRRPSSLRAELRDPHGGTVPALNETPFVLS